VGVQDLLANKTHRFSLQGSVFWMAPEVVKQSGHTSKADIWSVGCLVVEMFTGEHPWAQLTQMQAIFKVSFLNKKHAGQSFIFFLRLDWIISETNYAIGNFGFGDRVSC